MNVELHIECLVLDGLAVEPGRGELLRNTVAAELGELLRQGALDPALGSGGAFPHLDGGPVRWTPADGIEGLGRQIARAAYDGLGVARKG